MSAFIIISILGALYGFAYLLSLNPDWRVTQILFSFRGPLPTGGETFAHYMLRWARYSGLIALVFAVIFALVGFVDVPNYVAPYYLEQGAIFICGFGFLLSAVSCIGVLLRAMWHALSPRKYVFDQASQFFRDAA